MAKKYLIQNPIANASLTFIDYLLRAFKPFFKKKPLSLSFPQKILLSQGAHLGDVVLITALLKPLKKAYPDLKIGIIVGSWSKKIVEDHPLIDYYYIVDHWKINRAPLPFYKKILQYRATRKRAFKEIQQEGFDYAIDGAFHFPSNSIFLYQLAIPIRVGFQSAGFSSFLTHVKRAEVKSQSVSDLLFSLIKEIYPNLQGDRRPFLGNHERLFKENYIVMHIGAGDERKKWPQEKWKKLLKMVEKECALPIYFSGSGKEEEREMESIVQGSQRAVNLCNCLSWKEFLSLIEHAEKLISVDTVAGHIASAYDVPTLILSTGINPLHLWKPPSTQVTQITYRVHCSPCYKGCKAMSCIKKIDEKQVYALLKKSLKDQR